MSRPALVLDCVVSQPFAENSYLISLPGNSACIVVDPGFDPDAIIEKLEQNSLTPVAMLITHGHSDHIAGNETLRGRYPTCPIIIGKGDAAKLTDPMLNLSAPFGLELLSPPADQTVVEGEELELAGIRWEVRETPGHSSGHVVYVTRQFEPWLVIGGDVLFRGSVGRTDFPDGDTRQLMASIRDKLLTLPNDTIVLPGHGEPTTIGEERRTNPFLKSIA